MSFLPIRHALEQAQELEKEVLKPHDPFKSQHMFARAEDPNKDLQCKAPQMPQADIDNAEIRRILSKYFPQWRVDQILQETCPYCSCVTPRAFKVYKHPKDGDCVGIYTCDRCGKRWVKDGKVHAEVW